MTPEPTGAPDHGWTGVLARRYEDRVLLVLTLVIGALVGLVVVGFILLTENLGSRLYPAGGAPWRRLVIPTAGALGTGMLMFRYFPNARGSGIPQTKAALFIRDGFISLRTVLGKFGLCSVSLASGIALGREGPSVHVGAGIASVLGRRLGLSPSSIKALVPVGASAALAAAFNTPISAVLFSLEEVMGDLHAPVLGSIVLSSATSWIVLHLILGDEPLFHVPAYQLVHPVEFVFYAALGVIGGLVSVSFTKLLLRLRKMFLDLPRETQWVQPALGGLAVGIMGWYVPEVLGVGYSVVSQALNGQVLLTTMALLVCLKLAATATCYASGNAGGIFGPSLFIGAMMGGAVGGVAHNFAPDYTGSVGAYALVGMGAAFAGIVRVPLTSVIMIFEITRDYSIIVPLMIANLISYFISSQLQEEPIYEALQHQDGIHLPSGGHARDALLMVGHGYRPTARAIRAEDTLEHAAASVEKDRGAWPVVDAVGLRGMLTQARLDAALASGAGSRAVGELVPAPDPRQRLTAENFPHVHTDHSLDTAMRRLAETGLNALPVVNRADVRDLKGTITLQEVLATYGVGKPQAGAHEEPPHRKLPAGLLAGVLAACIAVAVLAGFLNYFYRAERGARAAKYFEAANELARKDRYEEAVAQYRNALSISHTPAHRLALASALVKAGHLNEGELYFRELLRDNPSSGPANLGLARALAQQGQIDDAAAYYHHAIYGAWPSDARENRANARLELARVLIKAGRQQPARAELLALAADLPPSPALQKETARAMLDNGMPREAAELFRTIGRQNPHDTEAWRGVARIEFASGDFTAARAAVREALRADPRDDESRKLAEACDAAMALDPAAPGLNSAERFRRAEATLRAAVEEAQNCAINEATLPAEAQSALHEAQAALSRRGRPASYGDATEADMTLARRVWHARVATCVSQPPAEDPAAAVIAKSAAR